jgi:hypothetical protein
MSLKQCKNGHPRTAENLYTSPGGQRQCKPCRQARDAVRPQTEDRRAAGTARFKRWREANPERFRAAADEWRERNPEAARFIQLRYRLKRFGLTEADYLDMVERQGGRCAICGCHEERHDRAGVRYLLAVDHDHTTGAVRGLLCQECNKGLGAFDDNPERLVAAAEYLNGVRHGLSGPRGCEAHSP